jgi:hypothetical protein
MVNRTYIFAKNFEGPTTLQTATRENTSPFIPIKVSNPLEKFPSAKADQGILIFRPVKPAPLLFQNPSTSRPNQSGRNQEQALANHLHHPLNLILIRHHLFKEIHQTVSQHQQLKISIITGIMMRKNLIQPKSINHLLLKVAQQAPLIINRMDRIFSFDRDSAGPTGLG